jgi:hypothetical protein
MRKLIILIAIIFGGVLSAQNSKVETITLVPKAAPSVGLGKVYFGLDGSLNIYDGVAWRYSILSNDAQFIANSAKIGITPTQAADILLNNAKVGITPTQAADIVLNNAKVGITPTQASNITLNNAKATNATHTGDVTGSGTLTIASNSVTSTKILDGTISFADMAINSIGAQNIIDGSVTTPDLQVSSVTNDKIFDNAVSETKISNNAVTSAKIVDGTIVAGDIANNTITGAKIAPLTIGNSNLAAQSVNSSIIADLGVNTVDLADNAVTSTKLAGSAVSGDKILDGTIGTIDLGNDIVTTAKIVNNTILGSDLSKTTTFTNGQFLQYNSAADNFTTAAGAGVTAEQTTRIAKENQFEWYNNLISGTPSATDIEQNTVNKYGLKTANYADGSEVLNVTLDGSHPAGTSLMYFLKTTTADINIKRANAGISLIFDGQDGTYTGVKLDALGHNVTIMATDVANEYFLVGSFLPTLTLYSPNNLYTTQGAMNVDDPSTALGGFSDATNGPLDIFAAETNDGPNGITGYSLRAQDVTGHSYRRISYTTSGLTNGVGYTLKFYIKRTTAGGTESRIDINGTGSSVIGTGTSGLWDIAQVSVNFTSNGADLIDIFPNWNNTGVFDINIAAYEIIAQ